MDDLVKAIPEAATSPYALFAYVVAAVAFVWVGSDVRQLKEIRRRANKNGQDVDPATLLKIIQTVTRKPLPPNMTGAVWLKHSRQMALFTLATVVVLVVGVVTAIAIIGARRNAALGRLYIDCRDGDILLDGDQDYRSPSWLSVSPEPHIVQCRANGVVVLEQTVHVENGRHANVILPDETAPKDRCQTAAGTNPPSTTNTNPPPALPPTPSQGSQAGQHSDPANTPGNDVVAPTPTRPDMPMSGALSKPTAESIETIVHRKARVTIDVPKNWKSSTNGDIVTLSDQKEDVAVTFVSINAGAINEATRAAKRELEKKIRNLTFGKPEEITINGMKGFGFSGDGYLGDKNIDLALVVLDTPAEDVDLFIIAIGEDARIAKHMNEVKWIFQRLRPMKS